MHTKYTHLLRPYIYIYIYIPDLLNVIMNVCVCVSKEACT